MSLTRTLATFAGALALVVAPACAWVISDASGNRVRVVLEPMQWPDDDIDATGRPGFVRREDGSEVLVERAFVAWSRVALVPCGPPLPPMASLLFANVARASHGPDTAIALTRPTVDGLFAPRATTLAELSPPSGHYCKLVIGVAAPSGVALGEPADLAMRGASLIVDGYFRSGPEAAWRAFALRESAAFDVTIDLGERTIDDGDALEFALGRSAADWLEGIDLASSDPTAASRAALESLQDATTVTFR